jgi:CheY-like chemotaxis protein
MQSVTTSYDSNIKSRKIFNILVVDDDVEIANMLKKILTIRGHTVSIVDDGTRCVSHCLDNSRKYDIVFLDYHMEGLNGAEAADIVRNNKKNAIIFAYTGDDSLSAIDNFKSVKMDGAIIKPIDIKSIELLMTNLEQFNCLDKTMIKKIVRNSKKSIMIFDEICVS